MKLHDFFFTLGELQLGGSNFDGTESYTFTFLTYRSLRKWWDQKKNIIEKFAQATRLKKPSFIFFKSGGDQTFDFMKV